MASTTREEDEDLATAAIGAEEEMVAAAQVSKIDSSEKVNPHAKAFYDKLHGMIKYAEENNLLDVVSYALSGKGITIHNKIEFEKLDGIMKTVFGIQKYRLFRQNLRRWHFISVRDKRTDPRTYVHPFFERKNRDSFYHMKFITSKRPPATVSPAAVVEGPNKRPKIGLLRQHPSMTAAAPAAAAAAEPEQDATVVLSPTPKTATTPVLAVQVAEATEHTTGSTVNKATPNNQQMITSEPPSAPPSPGEASATIEPPIAAETVAAAIGTTTETTNLTATLAMSSERQHGSASTAGDISASESEFNSIIDERTDEYNAFTNQSKPNKMAKMVRAVRQLPHLKDKDDAFIEDAIDQRMNTFIIQRKFAGGAATTTAVASEVERTTTAAAGTGTVVASTTHMGESGKISDHSPTNSDTSNHHPRGQHQVGDTLPVESTNGNSQLSESNREETIPHASQMVRDGQQIISLVEKLQTELSSKLQTGLSSISRECHKKNEELTRLRLQLLESQQRQRVTQERTQERDKALQELSLSRAKCEERIQERDKALQELSLSRAKCEERTQERGKALQELSQARAKCERLEKIHDETIQNLRDAQRNEIIRLRSDHQTEIIRLRSDHQTEIDDLHKRNQNFRDAQRNEIIRLRSDHQTEIIRLRSDHQTEIDDLHKRNHDNLKKIQISHKQELDDLRFGHNEVIEQHRNEVETVRSANKELEVANSAAADISAELDDVIRRYNEVQSYASQEYNRHQITKSERDDWKRRFEELQGEHQRGLRERDDLQEELNGRGTAVDL